MARRQDLWTPNGMVSTTEKNIVELTQKELILLGHLHEFAFKHKVTIFCQLCEGPITGQNNDQTLNPSVACTCREWRFKRQ